MHYVSIEYLLWMLGTFSLYWVSPAALRHYTLAIITFIFLLLFDPESTAILILFTLITAFVARQSEPSGGLVFLAITIILLVLVYFKLRVVGIDMKAIISDALIPLGLSYYSFRCMHFIIERYRGRYREVTVAEIIGYLFFLPTILVGPIHRFGAYQRDRYRIRLDRTMVSAGLERILYGYVKIGFLANFLVEGKLGSFVDTLPPESTSLKAYLWIVQGGLNLYFQFSGFADIAIGFSRLLGFQVIENFNWPFLRRNISEYWRCWHISLTSWCREYIYTTVVSFSRSPALGAIATLLTIGLWHELSVRYIVWGPYHGLGLVAWQRFQELKLYLPKINSPTIRLCLTVFSITITVHYVWFGFAIIRKESLAEVLEVWKLATFGFLM
jgi:D-alanyl-lipoteichoic acid acyltransferase DltB (MBOAT superfamily)